ncbi:alpha/beta fold hydrolase [soil metagenome]
MTPRGAPPDRFPWAARFLDVGGAMMAYLDEGSGPPVVMVHGNPTWSFAWRELITELCVDHRCVVADHVGMGRSDKPRGYPYTLARRVADFGRLMDEVVGSEPATLCVHDWGGAIALGWAVAHPHRVARLVILNTAAFRLLPGRRLPLALAAVRSRPFGDVVERCLGLFTMGAALRGVTRPLSRAVRRGYLAPYRRPSARVATRAFVRDIPVAPTDAAYATLAATEDRLHLLADRPALVCWGGRDPVFDGGYLAAWRLHLPDAEVHTFERAGHFVLEDARDEVAALVRGFLDRTAPVPS